MPSQDRLRRIGARIREELSVMLLMEVQDPRLGGISVTDVKVDRELAYADIFVSALEGQERAQEVLDGLRSAAGFLRRQLAARIDLRVFPRLRFHWDPTPERADKIERVLATLREEEPIADEPEEDFVETDEDDTIDNA
jgi:ribosome-binding factor A